jgi:DHA1 family bicyclomycin/chloramphenicol resistance-like MFS transporter
MLTPSPQRTLILWTLFAASCLALLQVSIYVPSMPSIARYFGVSISAIQLTVTIYAVGFAVGNLFWGPISDRYGRRPALIWGAFLCLVASGFCVFAPNLESLFGGRLVQAFGAASVTVAGRAVIRDIFDRLGTARALSLQTSCRCWRRCSAAISTCGSTGAPASSRSRCLLR